MNTYTITIQSMSPSGHGVGRLPNDTEVRVLGAFTDDIVEVKVYKKAEEITYAEIVRIESPSPFRTDFPQQFPFFDANAPWRYLSFQKENEVKKQLVYESFLQHAGIQLNSEMTQIPDIREYGYRNKAAYSFLERRGTLHFALYPRGTSVTEKQIQEENILVHDMINRAGVVLLNFFNSKKVALGTLKYLILRYSYKHNTVVAHILVTESSRKKLPWKKSDLEQLISTHPFLEGVMVSQSPTGIRSASVLKDFYSIGTSDIEEEVAGRTYRYHPSQFFQVYPYAFEQILKDCTECVRGINDHEQYELLDLFAGVGIIGIHLAENVRSVHGVEYSPLSKEYALVNAKLNGVENFSYTQGDVDELVSHITRDQIVVLDPPRSGLSREVLNRITSVQPQYLLYISCSPETQARDFNQLKEYYEVSYSQTYNLSPKTPHIEHLLFLVRK